MSNRKSACLAAHAAAGIDDYLELDAESKPWEYTVGWIDARWTGLSWRVSRSSLRRPWTNGSPAPRTVHDADRRATMGARPLGAKSFNTLYYRLHATKTAQRSVAPITAILLSA